MTTPARPMGRIGGFIVCTIATLAALWICFWTYLFGCTHIDMGGGGPGPYVSPCEIIFSSSEPSYGDILRAIAEEPKPVSASLF